MLKKVAIPIEADCRAVIQKGKNYVAITFDDAFQSVLQNAVPVLRDNLVPCIIFVPTAHIGKKPSWEIEENIKAGSEIVMTKKQLRGLADSFIKIGFMPTRIQGLRN